MPTVGVYVLLATLAAPALIKLGVDPLAAHFYVLYFGMLSMITPPIAIASFAAASVGETDPWKTAFASIKVGAGVYLIPVAFVLQPELLFIGDIGDTIIASLRVCFSVILLAAATVGYAGRPLGAAAQIGAGVLAFANVLPLSGGVSNVLLWLAFAVSVALAAWLLQPLALSRTHQ